MLTTLVHDLHVHKGLQSTILMRTVAYGPLRPLVNKPIVYKVFRIIPYEHRGPLMNLNRLNFMINNAVFGPI